MNKKYDYINKYQKEHYDRIILIAPKGLKEKLKKEAETENLSISAYILKKIK